jgi:alpha-tubulin suppressor-like RCC1 family protein
MASDGFAYCWGANDQGQLGTGDRQARATPTRVALQ